MNSISLAHKLKLKPGSEAAILNAPDDYLVELAPERVTIDHGLNGQYDWIQVFVRSKAEIDALYPALVAALKPESLLWISFPKGTSRIQTDLTRDKGWDSVTGLKLINLVSINTTWSAFSLRLPRPGETIRPRGQA
ncbi:MAG TPA: hypothetical protein VGK00_13850 [Anaerolineales bacterium]